MHGAAANRARGCQQGVPGAGDVSRAGPWRPWGTQLCSPSLVRLARAPLAFGRLFSSSLSMAS